MNLIKGAIFDIDGTVLDSMPIWETVAGDYLVLNGIVPRDGLREELRTLGGRQVGEYFIKNYGINKTPEEISDGIDKLLEGFYFDIAPPKPGVERVLQTLRDGGVPMCVATATDRHLVEAALKRTGLLQYFGHIFTCLELRSGKDEPYIFLRAAESLGTGIAETCVFEDALYAIRTAKKAGFPVVAVYDKSAKASADEIKALADVYLNSFDEFFFPKKKDQKGLCNDITLYWR